MRRLTARDHQKILRTRKPEASRRFREMATHIVFHVAPQRRLVEREQVEHELGHRICGSEISSFDMAVDRVDAAGIGALVARLKLAAGATQIETPSVKTLDQAHAI